jgi:Zn-dependent protease
VFGVPNPTPLDLHFRIFGVPVRVHPAFWILSAVLQWELLRVLGIGYLLLWVACVFVSILLHELGHVFMGRLFGSRGHIVLYSLGGLAVGSSDLARRWQRILVSLAGPGIQLLFFGLVLAFGLLFLPRLLHSIPPGAVRPVRETMNFLLEINLIWAIFNLLPIWPLDGGRVSREVCQWLSPGQGVRASLVLSILTCAVLALNTVALYYEWPWSLAKIHPLLAWVSLGHPINALFVGLLGASNFMDLQQQREGGPRRPWQRRDEDAEDRLPWERDPDYWKSGRRDPWD